MSIETNITDPYSTPATFKVKVGPKVVTINVAEPSGGYLLRAVDLDPKDYYLVQSINGQPAFAIETNDNIDASEPGLEYLEPVLRAGRYLVRVNDRRHAFTKYLVTGRELLALEGKPPELYRLDQILLNGEGHNIGPDETVDLREAGIERFITVEKKGQPECASIKVTILTPIGEWKTNFPKATLVSGVIAAVLEHFSDFDRNKPYEIRRGVDVLSAERTLESYNMCDGEKLKFLPAQDGGGQ